MSPTLWLLLVLLIIVPVAVVTLRERISGPTKRKPLPRSPKSRDDELRNLGISDVRPTSPDSSTRDNDDSGIVESTEHIDQPSSSESSSDTMTPAESSPRELPLAESVQADESTTAVDPARPEEPKARPARVRVRDNASLWRSREDAAARLLDSLAVLCHGRTALFHVNKDTQSVEVVAVAGGSRLELRSQSISKCPIIGQASEQVVSVPAGSRGDLFYHPAPKVGIAEAKIVRVTESPHLVLAVDVPAGERFNSELTGLVGEYANLLSGMLAVDPELTFESPGEETAGTESQASDPDDDESEAPDLFSQSGKATGASEPPRLQILSDELAVATDQDQSLAFALVAPRKADDLLETHADDIRGLEQEIADRILTVEGTRRVEPFGDLLLGVFCDLDGSEFDDWAEAVAIETPVHIGAVLVAPGNGSEAETIRDKAADAVQSAYESGEACVVITA